VPGKGIPGVYGWTGSATCRSHGGIRRVDAAQLPLCLLMLEMHNHSLLDQAFAQAGALGA
jgi:hypothetical protein